jgi:FlaA1/EpsC-like NDP-sugar epimerase
MVLMAAALAFMGYVVARYRVRLIAGIASRWLAFRGGALAARERVLIMGGGDAGQFVSWMLHNGREGAAFHMVGFVDDDLYKQNTRIRGVQVLGRRAEIPQLVRQYDIGIIVFTIHNISTAERRQVLDICADTPARVVMVPDILGALNGMTPPGEAVQDSGVETTPEEKPLACQHCLARVSPEQVDDWLAELTTIAGAGNTTAPQARIHHLRRHLRVADG